jgi:hypothetical protein
MTVFGIAMVRDELDILGFTLAHMLTQVDAVLIADNQSRDGTGNLLRGWFDDRLTIVDDLEVGYWQSRKMSALAEHAMNMGATWVVPWDADEAWFTRSGQRIRDALDALPPTVLIAEADLWDHVPTSMDPEDPNPLRRIGWHRSYPGPLPKVAARALPGLVIEQGNHGASFPGRDLPGKVSNLLTLRHFALRSPEQMVRKVRNGSAAYAATDLPEDQGKHWRDYGHLLDSGGPAAIGDVFHTWFHSSDPASDPSLIYDPAPVACPLPS